MISSIEKIKQENINESPLELILELAGLFYMAFQKQHKCYLLWKDFLALTSMRRKCSLYSITHVSVIYTYTHSILSSIYMFTTFIFIYPIYMYIITLIPDYIVILRLIHVSVRLNPAPLPQFSIFISGTH